ncbi:8051_t:CDS:1, partial [Cetraspora pellucida]
MFSEAFIYRYSTSTSLREIEVTPHYLGLQQKKAPHVRFKILNSTSMLTNASNNT